METAKVDIRKLQLLNDRINQTIDALNQVRLSVHGVQAWGNPYGQSMGTQGFGQMGPIGQMGLGQVPGMMPGFAHSSFGANPYQQLQGMNPMLAQLWGMNPVSSFGGVGQSSPYGSVFGQQGLGHTSPEQQYYGDPSIVSRIAQTFPFVQWPHSPLHGYGSF